MPPECPNSQPSWPIAFVFCCLTFAITAQLNECVLDWEEYYRITRCSVPFTEYISGQLWRLGMALPEWASLRLFGAHAEGWRLFSMLAAFSALLLALPIARRLLNSNLLAAMALAVLGLNVYFLEYARWAFFPYSASIACGAAFLCLFLRIHTGTTTRWTRVASVLVAAVTPLVFLPASAVLLAAAPAAILAAHPLCPPESRPPLRAKLREMLFFLAALPTALFAISPILTLVLYPSARGTVSPENYRTELYFLFSGAPHTVLGFLSFYGKQTIALLYGCVLPAGPGGHVLTCSLLGLLALGFLSALLRRRTNPQALYLALFFLAVLSVLILLNLFSYYPFGHVRYARVLLLPSSILCALGAGEVLAALARIRPFRSSGALVTVASAGLCLMVLYSLAMEAERRLLSGRRAVQVISTINADVDCILVESRYRELFTTNATAPTAEVSFVEVPLGAKSDAVLEPETVAALASGQYDTVATLWSRPWFGRGTINSQIRKHYTEVSSAKLFMPDYSARFLKHNLTATLFRKKQPLNAPQPQEQ